MNKSLKERKMLVVNEMIEAVKECSTGAGIRVLINTYCINKEFSPNGRIIGTLIDGSTILFKKTNNGLDIIESCSIFVENVPILNWNKNIAIDSDPIVAMVA